MYLREIRTGSYWGKIVDYAYNDLSANRILVRNVGQIEDTTYQETYLVFVVVVEKFSALADHIADLIPHFLCGRSFQILNIFKIPSRYGKHSW